MTICKFFLQGTCKYGDSCRYSHQINDTSVTSSIHGTSIMRQNSKPSTIDTNLLINSVVTDMINAEKGGHWLFSSYTPFKDKYSFPGFENQSFEEIRYGYYEAMKNGTVEQYKQKLQIAVQEAAMRMKTLQNPTSEIISMLIQIYNTPITQENNVTSTSSPSNSVFQQNQTPSGSIFAIANQQLFGKSSNQQQSIFGGPATAAKSIFGAAAPHNPNTFSNNQTGFNNQGYSNTSNKSIFGNQNLVANSNYQNSPFATQNPPFSTQSSSFSTQNNVFAQSNTNIFQTTTNSPLGNKGQSLNNTVFSQNQPFNNMNSISTNMSSLPFGGQSQQYASKTGPSTQAGLSPMEQPQESSQTSSTANTVIHVPNTNIFTQQISPFNNQGTDQKLTNSIFAQNIPQPGNVFSGSTEMINSNAYSKLEDLSESDIKSFESESFEFGKIPEKPPTAQMCN